jgi:phosphoadenosine phosphosulfate reductase
MNNIPVDLDVLNSTFESASPQDILAWSWQTFGLSAVSSSAFQPQSIVLLHMIAQICSQMPIIFTDTQFHFPETLAFRDEVAKNLKLNVQSVYPDAESLRQLDASPEPLYMRNPDLCCRIRKVEPMAKALEGKRAWVAGVRREQTRERSQIQIVELRPDGIYKISPLANWSKKDVWRYIDEHNLPIHPLFSQGYPTIGCSPCTRPVFGAEDERAGRWAGTEKNECGLHTIVLPASGLSQEKR